MNTAPLPAADAATQEVQTMCPHLLHPLRQEAQVVAPDGKPDVSIVS